MVSPSKASRLLLLSATRRVKIAVCTSPSTKTPTKKKGGERGEKGWGFNVKPGHLRGVTRFDKLGARDARPRPWPGTLAGPSTEDQVGWAAGPMLGLVEQVVPTDPQPSQITDRPQTGKS